ncbi:hypothetical protein N9B05_05500 [Mariniblastus sp.]|nr:hypothetical protein [Mariniblastus sp.]
MLNKAKSLELARSKYGVVLENANTHYSKVNAGKAVWWIEIPIAKFEKFEFINLVVEQSGDVTLLKVPTEFFRNNLSGFRIREQKQVVCLELDIDTFQNVIGEAKVSFKQFVISS